MELASGESIIYQGHPSWRATLGIYIKGDFLALLFAGLAAGITYLIDDEINWAVVAIVLIATMLIVMFVGYVKRIGTQYTITNRRLHIRRGILNRTTEETRIERIQNANTSQSFLERMLKVGTVDFDVASDERAGLFKFAGVEDPTSVVSAVNRAQMGTSAAIGIAPVSPGGPPDETASGAEDSEGL